MGVVFSRVSQTFSEKLRFPFRILYNSTFGNFTVCLIMSFADNQKVAFIIPVGDDDGKVSIIHKNYQRQVGGIIMENWPLWGILGPSI